MFKIDFCFCACFQVICLSISDSKFRRLGLLDRVFRKEEITEIDVPRKLFCMGVRTVVVRVLKALGAAFLIFCFANRSEHW